VIPSLYIRIRGRVQGPFDEERLRALVRRGQVSRIHEVSEDGTRWTKAGDFGDLFEQPAVTGANQNSHAATQSFHHSQSVTALPAPEVKTAPASAPVATWYFIQDNLTKGPVDFHQLQSMCANGQLSAEAHVWSDGMAQWVAARMISGLVPNDPVAANPEQSPVHTKIRGGDGDRKLGVDVTRALSSSYAWVLFITIMIYLYALATFVSAITLIIQGAKADSSFLVGNGLAAIVMAILYAVGALLLNIYCNCISRVQVVRSEQSLESALTSLRTFWVFIGIVMIVFLAFVVVFGIVVLSLAGEVRSTF
jgi:hypothetical protein